MKPHNAIMRMLFGIKSDLNEIKLAIEEMKRWGDAVWKETEKKKAHNS